MGMVRLWSAAMSTSDGRGSEESHKERVDRELIELLNEIRVALPGVQVLFAFLLTVPFANGYGRMNSTQRDLILVSLVAAGVAIACLVAPTAQHRILFRARNKERLLFHANELLLAGTVFLAISMVTSVYVVSDIVIGGVTASLITAFLAALFITLWYIVPLRERLRTARGRS
jgi:hypothetical protein